MKFYNTFKKGDGSYRTYEFSAEEMLNLDIITFVIVGSICALLSTIASAVLIIVTLHDYEREGIKPSIWGSFIGLYFLIDMYNHWILWIFLRILEGEYWLNIFYNLNIAYFVTHLFLVIFGATVYYNVEDPSQRKTKLVMATAFVFFGTLLMIREFF